MTPGRPGWSFRLNGRRGRAGPAQTSSTVAIGEHCRSRPSLLRAGNARAVQRLIPAAEEAEAPARHGGWLLESATAEVTHRHKAGLPGGKRLHPGFATCATGRLVGHPGVMSGRSADVLCRNCGSRRCACYRPDPRDLQAHLALARLGEQPPASTPTRLPVRTEAVSQTNGIGAKQQRLGEPPETDASGELLRASVGSARLICLDADTCSWRSITNNFRSVTFVKRPRRPAAASCARWHAPARPAEAGASAPNGGRLPPSRSQDLLPESARWFVFSRRRGPAIPTSSTRWPGVLLGSHKHDRGVLELVCLPRAAPDAAGLFA
jgi:hypothetical protein